MENVKNIVSKKFMPLYQAWLDYLEGLGYKNFYKILNAKDYGIPQNRERCFMVSIRDKNARFEFPIPIPLTKKLADLLENHVDEKYFLSEKLIACFTDMSERHGFIRGLKFRPKYMNETDYAFTITTHAGYRPTDNYIIVPQATKAGYAFAEVGDGVYTNRCQYKRGVVQRSMIPTIKTSVTDIGVVAKDKDELISIRRLTPRECWRLMGWYDDEIDKVINEFSNTQLYKMAGNGIVLNTLYEIFFELLHF